MIQPRVCQQVVKWANHYTPLTSEQERGAVADIHEWLQARGKISLAALAVEKSRLARHHGQRGDDRHPAARVGAAGPEEMGQEMGSVQILTEFPLTSRCDRKA